MTLDRPVCYLILVTDPGTDKLFSFGVQQNVNDAGKVDGYPFPLCMFDIMNNRHEIIGCHELRNIVSCLYWKKEEYTIKNGRKVLRKVRDAGPNFFEMSDVTDLNDARQEINPRDLIKTYCHPKLGSFKG